MLFSITRASYQENGGSPKHLGKPDSRVLTDISVYKQGKRNKIDSKGCLAFRTLLAYLFPYRFIYKD